MTIEEVLVKCSEERKAAILNDGILVGFESEKGENER